MTCARTPVTVSWRSDAGQLTTTKLRFQGDETPRQVADRVLAAVRFGRSDKQSRADKETT